MDQNQRDIRMDNIEQKVVHIEGQMTSMNSYAQQMGKKLDKIFHALLGSELAGDGGMVKRLAAAEAEIVVLRAVIASKDNETVKTSLYVKTMWAIIGAVGAAIFSGLVAFFVHKMF